MSLLDPFSPNSRLRCACGAHGSQAEHEAQVEQGDVEGLNRRVVESAVMRAIFPRDD